MTERDVPRQVPVASYGYRHEAEFAAGFLDDAGVPYRLQLDDPALGTSVAMRATIWVLSTDLDRVRDILELDDDGSGRQLTSGPPGHRVAPDRTQRAAVGWSRLDVRERMVAGAVAGGLVAASTTLGGITFGQESAAFGALLVGTAALVGRAPRALKALLSALTGGEP